MHRNFMNFWKERSWKLKVEEKKKIPVFTGMTASSFFDLVPKALFGKANILQTPVLNTFATVDNY